ncbi:uncharacterized protein GIQ15_03839 [Arthroderma uncinatum]|uniref:uncharacterized protein n=1 Tax=Arthroderma uncinatum TaxID=74035 RepID=UPI00144AF879|nr:uncharacterized protein GIQ15_03839 [Arthroderma uncinatum]KAF3481080.1 hypothetical protein GIQ15_03839 [Arthroderma uncinatum]
MCNAFLILFKCGHVDYAEGVPCLDPSCAARQSQYSSQQVCRYCINDVSSDFLYANVDHTAALQELLFEQNFDVEMIDPEIYRGFAGVDELSVSFDQPEDRYSGRDYNDYHEFPTELDSGIHELQMIEPPAQNSYIYPSPITSVFDWDQLKEAHEHPGYEDYVPSPDEEDIRGTPRDVTTTSASSIYSRDSDMLGDYTTPSPPCTPHRRRISMSSPGTSCSPPLAPKRFDLRELSPTPGTRGHESFLDAASAILDLPLSWRENETLREFLDGGEAGIGADEDDDEDDDGESDIDYTTPQYTKMRQPDFLRSDYADFPPLDGLGTRSLVTMSTGGYTKLGAPESLAEGSTPVDTEDDDASMPRAITGPSSGVNVGPFALGPSEVMSSDA